MEREARKTKFSAINVLISFFFVVGLRKNNLDSGSWCWGTGRTWVGFEMRRILGQVARKLGLVESLLDLVVDELDEGVVLLGQLLLEYPVVFLSDFVGAFLKTRKNER